MRRAALAGLLLAGLAAGPASAAQPEAQFDPSAQWPSREVIVSLSERGIVAPGDVRVLEDGKPVDGVTVAPRGGARGVVLAIDASQSMRGAPIEQAMDAARRFARRRDPAAPLGIVLFSREPRVVLPPTTDARRIDAALATTPQLTKGTRSRDAASAAIHALEDAGLRSGAVVLLSDGADAGSTTPLPALRRASRRTGARVFTVALRSRSGDDGTLAAIAAATGGRAGDAARPADLPPIFAAIGRRLSAEHTISYRSPARAGEAVRVDVRVDGDDLPPLRYEAPGLPQLDVPARPAQAQDALSWQLALPVGLAALAALLLGLVLRPREKTLAERLEAFTPTGPAPVEADPLAAPEARPRDARSKRLAEDLELAGIGRSLREFRMLTAVATGVVAVLLGATGGVWLVPLAAFVPVAARAHVRRLVARRRAAFAEQLPDNLQVMAAGLRAGHSMSAALAGVIEEAEEPSRSELSRVVADQQLGVELDEALTSVSRRMRCAELEYVGVVARLQREGGGSTAEVLDGVVETVRGRQELRRTVVTLTAQGRLGGVVVTAMPIIATAFLSMTQPGYFDPLLSSPIGVALLVLAAGMLASGWIVIQRIVHIEV